MSSAGDAHTATSLELPRSEQDPELTLGDSLPYHERDYDVAFGYNERSLAIAEYRLRSRIHGVDVEHTIARVCRRAASLSH